MIAFSSAGHYGSVRVMIFIDGGYLQKQLQDIFQSYNLNYNKLRLYFYNITSSGLGGGIRPEVIRTYYYDAIPASENEIESKQKENIAKIREQDHFELRFGHLICVGKRDNGKPEYRQKGVDTLIAIDMITKAYQNHYDVAVILAGDRDFLNVVEAVKNAGKRVFGVYFKNRISSELHYALDMRRELERSTIEQMEIVQVLQRMN